MSYISFWAGMKDFNSKYMESMPLKKLTNKANMKGTYEDTEKRKHGVANIDTLTLAYSKWKSTVFTINAYS